MSVLSQGPACEVSGSPVGLFGWGGVQEPWVSVPELHAHHPISKHFPTELHPWPQISYSEIGMKG